MPCKTCGGSSIPPQIKKIYPETQAQQVQSRFTDEQMVLISYEHPNRGQHSVVGAASKINYGYRGGGEKFLAHIDDIAAQPQYFRRVQPEQVLVPKSEVKIPPPPPEIVEAQPIQEAVTPSPLNLLEGATEVKAEPVPASVPTAPIVIDPLADIDLDIIPGVTPTIAKELRAVGLTNPRAIMDIGIEGLQTFKGIGKQRAAAIVEYAAKKAGL